MLNTNICVELIRGRAAGVFKRLQQFSIDEVSTSSITLAELQYSVTKSANPSRNAMLLAKFGAPLAILSFDNAAAEVYGLVRGSLERKGTPIGPLDTLIASHALSLANILVTNNQREFRRVEGLPVENWLGAKGH
jgi:tRNA(fMet)-specific endonuclease VapC